MQNDLQGLGVCSHHNELRDASVEGFGSCGDNEMRLIGDMGFVQGSHNEAISKDEKHRCKKTGKNSQA